MMERRLDGKRTETSHLSPEAAKNPGVLSNQSGKENTGSKRLKTHRAEDSNTGSSISFPVKRSGLASKQLDAPAPFLSKKTDELATGDDKTISPSRGEHVVRLPNSHNSSDLHHRKKRKRNSSLDKLHSRTVSKSSSSEKRSSSPHSTSTAVPKRANSYNKVKTSPTDNGTHVSNVRNRSESVSENDTETGSVDQLASDGHGNSPSRPPTSASLVAYNSSEEDHIDLPRKYPKDGKQKRRSGSHTKKTSYGDPSQTHAKSIHSSSKVNSVEDPKEVKVVKPTAKSTWDSSDSDFEASTVTAPGNTSAPTVTEPPNNMSSPDASHSSQTTTQVELVKKRKRSFKRYASEPEGVVKREPTLEDNQRDSAPSKELPFETRRSSKRDKLKHSRHKRRRSYSSHSSSVSPTRRSKGRSALVVEDRAECPADVRHLSPSHDSASSRSSDNESQYSTVSSRSGSWRRHRHRRRRRSKSYTSRSSSRGSSNFSRGYRDRTKSRSRSGRRHRRRTRSSYRRSRRRSYSSRSRSRSWRTSDSSSHTSYRSSRSSSRASSISHRRSSTVRRSSSRPSPVHKKIISNSKLSATERSRSPEGRFVRIGGGALSRGSASDQQVNQSVTTSFSFSSVADTVSAAVKRVTGGNSGASRFKTHSDGPASQNQRASSANDTVKQESVKPGKSTLVDIPLPQSAGQSSCHDNSVTEQLSSTTEAAPYIGPQLPPELARRFGLSVNQQSTIETESSSRGASDTMVSNPSSGTTQQNSNDPTTSQSNSMEFLIPPEKVEQYRALQEQAKQHALRRSNLLVTGDSTETTMSAVLPSEANLQSQRLALLASAGLVYPTYSGDVALLAHMNSGTTSLAVTDSGFNQNVVRLAEDARLAAFNTQIQNQLLNSMASSNQQNAAVRALSGPDQLAAALAGGKVSNYDASSVPAVLPASLHQQLQHTQLQQLIAAANAIQAAQSGGSTVQTQQQPQPVITAQLLQQLAIQQAQKLQTANLPANAISASALQTHLQQQQKLQAQLLKQASDQLQSSTDGQLTAVSLFNDATSSASFINPIVSVAVNSPVATASVWPSGFIRTPVAASAAVANPVVSAISLKNAQQAQAFFTAAQQQQLLAAALRQQQAPTAGFGMPQETQQTVLPVQLAQNAVARLFASQQQQQILAFQALQQRQLLQQQQQRVLVPVSGESSLFQAQLAAAVQQQQQKQLSQLQLQQLQHQALAASAIAAAQSQRQQQQQQDQQDRTGKTL